MPKTMKNLTLPDVLAPKEMSFNSYHPFITRIKGDKCLEEYLKREILLSLIYRQPAFLRHSGSN